MSSTILGIDIGSTKICAIIAEERDGDLFVIGAGIAKSQGLKRGVVTNIELTSKAIKNAVNDAKRVAGTNYSKAVISISGVYTKGLNSSGIVNIPNSEITIKEIHRVMNTAIYNANILNEYEILHVLPYNFKLDDQNYIDDPLGMNGNRLEAFVHIITAQKTNLNNLKKAVSGAGIEIENIVLAGYASSISTIKNDEKELGVAVIDIGGATCNLVIHSLNSVKYSDFLGVGSYNITNDISYAFHTPISVAEKIKVEYGTLLSTLEDEEKILELPVIGDEHSSKEVYFSDIQNIIRARVEETLIILAKKIEESGEQLGAGVVLTGGMTKLKGIKELASSVFGDIPVKISRPKEINGVFNSLKDPAYSTVVGLILYGLGKSTPYEIDSSKTLNFKINKIDNINLDTYQEMKNTREELEKMDDGAAPAVTMSTRHDLATITENQNQKGNKVSKFWQWITHLF